MTAGCRGSKTTPDTSTGPDLSDLEDGETVENRYEYDKDRLNRAWSRKVTTTKPPRSTQL